MAATWLLGRPGVATYDRASPMRWHRTRGELFRGGDVMAKFVLLASLVVIGVAAGFIVRLLIPGSRLGGASSRSSVGGRR